MSPIIPTVVGLTCKAVLNSGVARVTVDGLPNLMEALNNNKRDQGVGVVTVGNHISTLDDPVTWGVMPARTFLKSRMTRWTLGASEVIFTNPVFSYFFRHGQVLETFRGKGIFQRSVNTAIELLNRGEWVHLYGEGKITQSDTYHTDENGHGILPRFRWGVGRIISSPTHIPTVIPMWITGFDSLMPEGRPFPFKYFPRPGARLSVTFGNPIPSHEIQGAIEKIRATYTEDSDTRIRAEVTSIVHRAVERLAKSVSGDSLRDTKYS